MSKVQSLSRGWVPSVAVIGVTGAAIALAVGLVPSRIDIPLPRPRAAESEAYFFAEASSLDREDGTQAQGATVAQPVELAPASEGEVVTPSGEVHPAAAVEAAPNPVFAIEVESGPAAQANVGPAQSTGSAQSGKPGVSRLVTVWPSARRLRREARLAAQAQALAAAPSVPAAHDGAQPTSSAFGPTAPQIVYVPLPVPIFLLEGQEGEVPVEVALPAEEPAGFQVGLVKSGDE